VRLKAKVILVVGHHNSGKTRTIKLLVSRLRSLGFKVATMKHVHELDFTFDLRGKDTWRHGAAGAEATLAVSPNEIVLFRRLEACRLGWEEILSMLGEDYDFILAEGFRRMAGRRENTYKLVTARSLDEAESLLNEVSPSVLAIVGWGVQWAQKTFKGAPVLRLPEEADRLTAILLGEG